MTPNTSKYNREYYLAHRTQQLADRAKYRTENRNKFRATVFCSKNRDCTSPYDEVLECYEASIDVTTGKPGKVGWGSNELGLDHIHGGPIVGLIPQWLNKLFTEDLYEDGHLQTFMEHLERRSKCIT